MTPGTIAADVVREECRGSSRTVTLNGIQVDLDERGSGRPILFLHPETGPDQHVPVLDLLAQKSRLIAPSHPGFGRSPAAPSITTVDDLAYLYLDLLKALDLRNVCVVGISLGAWIAAEIAIKSTERLSSMIFANPIGIKVGGREQRDIKDIFALREEEYLSLAYSDMSRAVSDYSGLSDAKLLEIARNREATARYCWSPYMHDPKLKSRMHRIDVRSFVLWGEDDGLASPDYGAAFARLIPAARFEVMTKAGRFPHVEQAERFADTVFSFLKI